MGKIIAIIPARAGSKRLPHKNILDISGKPMICWTIEAAQKSGIFSDILVSTDGETIADLSKKAGASAPFLRNGKDADDYTPVSIATVNALIEMEKYTSIKYDIVVQLMPNCPCRTHADIIEAYNGFLQAGIDFQISVFKFGWMNPWWALKKNNQTGSISRLFPETYDKRSQDLEELFCPTGAIWIAKASALKSEKTFYGSNFRIFPINWQSAVDIDEDEDFKMAQAVFYLRNQEKNSSVGQFWRSAIENSMD